MRSTENIKRQNYQFYNIIPLTLLKNLRVGSGLVRTIHIGPFPVDEEKYCKQFISGFPK